MSQAGDVTRRLHTPNSMRVHDIDGSDQVFVTSMNGDAAGPPHTGTGNRPKFESAEPVVASLRQSYATADGVQRQREKLERLFENKHQQIAEREARNTKWKKEHDRKWKMFERRIKRERDKDSQKFEQMMEDVRSKTLRVKNDIREMDNQAFEDYTKMKTDRRKMKEESDRKRREQSERLFKEEQQRYQIQN